MSPTESKVPAMWSSPLRRSMVNSRAFGPLVAAEAQSRDFYAAQRRAFVADGCAYNWSIQRGYFADFVPIVDLLHVGCLHRRISSGPTNNPERS